MLLNQQSVDLILIAEYSMLLIINQGVYKTMNTAEIETFKKHLGNIYSSALTGTATKSYDDLAKDLKAMIDNIAHGRRALLGLTFQIGEGTHYDNARIPLAKFARGLAQGSASDALNVAKDFFSSPDLSDHELLTALRKSFGCSMSADSAHKTLVDADASGAVVRLREGACSEPGPVHDAPDTIKWLNKMLTKLVTSAENERFTIHEIGSNVTVTVKGPLPLHYAARSFLMNMAPSEKPLPVIVNPETTESVFVIDGQKIKKAKTQQQAIDFTKMWLESQGFIVSTGSKSCEMELWVNVRPFETRDDIACRGQCGISLAVAEKIATFTDTRCIFPTTVQVEARGSLRDQLEFYYREAQLIGADGQPKQFILNELGQKTDYSNISLGQAQHLWPYFQRLEMLAKRINVRCASLNNEAAVREAQEQIRSITLDAQEKMLSVYRYRNASSASLVSYLTYESVSRPSTAVSIASSSIVGMFASRGASSIASGRWNEVEYERAFETMVNKLLIPGPEAYKLILNAGSELATGVRSVENVLKTQSGGGARALALTDGSDFRSAVAREVDVVRRTPTSSTTALVGYNPEFARRHSQLAGRPSIAEYFVHLAQKDASDLFTSPLSDAATARRCAELERLGRTDLYNRLDELRDFYAKHSPYYFIKQMAGTLVLLLENPATSEEAIAEILLRFGVKEADLAKYHVRDTQLFNRYQIKFDALALALTACLSNGVVLNLSHVAEWRHPWVFNPQQGDIAKTPDTFRVAMEWHLNKVFLVGWGVGSSSSSSYSTYTSSGSRADSALHTAGSFAGSHLSSASSYSGSQMYQSGSGSSTSCHKSG